MSDMSPAEAIFFAALELTDPAARAAYLDGACAGRPELRTRVDRLLAAHPRVGAFLEPPPAPGPGATGTFEGDDPDPPPRTGPGAPSPEP